MTKKTEEIATKIAEMIVNQYIKNNLNNENIKDVSSKATEIYISAYASSFEKITSLTMPKEVVKGDEHPKLQPVEQPNYTR